MQLAPIKDVAQARTGERPTNKVPLDFYGDLELACPRMEMRWTMFLVEHADDDAEETRQFGHCAVRRKTNAEPAKLRSGPDTNLNGERALITCTNYPSDPCGTADLGMLYPTGFRATATRTVLQ